jgi:benzodiazapine receptor
MKQGLILAVFLVAVFAVAGLGGWLTSFGVKEWYQALQKPAWNPPSWIFGPVWTALYLMMALAAWMVWMRHSPLGKAALTLWAIQLALNLGWSAVFFYMRQPGWAFLEIIVLLAAIIATAFMFFRISSWAGALFLPYIAWVSFATFLNYTIWRLNS